jgi:hypothetical protein
MVRRRVWALALLVFAPILVFVAITESMKSDTIPKQSAAFISITQRLSQARETIAACWKEKDFQLSNCKTLKEQLPKPKSEDEFFLVSEQGALVGIDFVSRVIVVLTPAFDGVNLKWHCSGSPSYAITKSCNPLN